MATTPTTDVRQMRPTSDTLQHDDLYRGHAVRISFFRDSMLGRKGASWEGHVKCLSHDQEE